MNATAARVPGPRERPVVGSTLEFQKQPLDFCLRAKQRYGDVVRFNVALSDWYLIGNPEDVYRVLVADAARFHKPKLAKRLWRPFLGDGLLASDGDFWKKQHKLVQPGFHKARVEAYAETMVRYTEDLLATWTHGARRDFCNDMTNLTLAVVAKTLFDADVHGEARRVGKAIETVNEVLCAHINRPIPVPRWWPSAANKKKVRALDDVRTLVRGIIDERRTSGKDKGDLLSMLAFAEDESGRRMSDEELHDEAMTLFFAGHETTAIALTWMWYLLARHPEVEQRLREELAAVAGARALTVADLAGLPYLDAVVKESMRLLPPVWSYMREPVEDYELGGHVIPKGSIVFIVAYLLHHDARSFPEPEAFRPERFFRENEKKIPRGAYVPFAAGPRVCLGKSFALMEARLILGTLMQRARPKLRDGYEAKLLPQLSLRPEGGMPIDVVLRDAPSVSAHPPALAETA